MRVLAEGQYVKHSLYGFGVITESDADRTTIDFDLYGPKKFVTSLMVVDRAEGKPPQRPPNKRRKKAPTTPAPAGGATSTK